MSKLEELIKGLFPDGVDYYYLGDIGKFYGGLTGKSKDDFKDGNAKFITYKNVYSNPALDINPVETVKILPNENQRILEYGDIIFTGSSETPDECGFSSVVTRIPTENLYLNSFCFIYRLNDKNILLPDFSKHNFNLVIVWKLDRFARNRYDSAHYKALLKKNGVKVMSAVERISDGAEGILLESVLEGMAEYYSADLSEKVLRGHTENALKCKYNGGTMPIGYYADKEQHYVADSLTAPFVLEAFRHYDEGLTMSEIAAVLNQHGLKNKRGGDIDIDSVSRMLSNRKYIGEYRYRDIVIPNGIPALVPQDLFDRVQEKIAKNKKAPARHKAEDDYLLTTKLFCGECESLMVGECGTSRSGAVHHYYKCTNAKRHGGCRKKAIKKDWIENLVVLEIRKKLEDARFIDDIVHAFMKFQTAENTVIPHLKQSLAELNKSIDNILAAIEQGIFTQSTKQRLEELESKKKDIEIEIAKESIRRPLLNEDQVRFWFERLRNLNINELSHRKRLIDTFLNSVFVYDDKLLINCNYPNTSTIVRFSDINATLNGSDILACGRPKQRSS